MLRKDRKRKIIQSRAGTSYCSMRSARVAGTRCVDLVAGRRRGLGAAGRGERAQADMQDAQPWLDVAVDHPGP